MKSYFKKIIAVFATFAIVVSLSLVPVSAEEYESRVSSWWDSFIIKAVSESYDFPLSGDRYYLSFYTNKSDICLVNIMNFQRCMDSRLVKKLLVIAIHMFMAAVMLLSMRVAM